MFATINYIKNHIFAKNAHITVNYCSGTCCFFVALAIIIVLRVTAAIALIAHVCGLIKGGNSNIKHISIKDFSNTFQKRLVFGQIFFILYFVCIFSLNGNLF